MKKAILAVLLCTAMACGGLAAGGLGREVPEFSNPMPENSPYLYRTANETTNTETAQVTWAGDTKEYSTNYAIGYNDKETIITVKPNETTQRTYLNIEGTVTVNAKIVIESGAELYVRLKSGQTMATLKRGRNLENIFEVRPGGTLDIRPSDTEAENEGKQIFLDGNGNAKPDTTGALVYLDTSRTNAKFQAVNVTMQNAVSSGCAVIEASHEDTADTTVDRAYNRISSRNLTIQNCQSVRPVIFLANIFASFQSSTIANNECTGVDGSVIYCDQDYVRLDITDNSTVSNNKSAGKGGVLRWEANEINEKHSNDDLKNPTANITGVTFSGNSAPQGGAIYANASGVFVTGCTFTNNADIAPAQGRLVYCDGATISHDGTIAAADLALAAGTVTTTDGSVTLTRLGDALTVTTANTAPQVTLAPCPREQSHWFLILGGRVLRPQAPGTVLTAQNDTVLYPANSRSLTVELPEGVERTVLLQVQSTITLAEGNTATVTFPVALGGNRTGATVQGLPAGEYEITVDNWSWRYSMEDTTVDLTFENQSVKLSSLSLNRWKWLDGECSTLPASANTQTLLLPPEERKKEF